MSDIEKLARESFELREYKKDGRIFFEDFINFIHGGNYNEMRGLLDSRYESLYKKSRDVCDFVKRKMVLEMNGMLDLSMKFADMEAVEKFLEDEQ